MFGPRVGLMIFDPYFRHHPRGGSCCPCPPHLINHGGSLPPRASLFAPASTAATWQSICSAALGWKWQNYPPPSTPGSPHSRRNPAVANQARARATDGRADRGGVIRGQESLAHT